MGGEPISICRQSLAKPRSISGAAVKELFSAFELVKARTLLPASIQSRYRPEIITTDEVCSSVCDRAGPSCVSATRSRKYFDPISAISLHPNTALDKRWLCRRTCEKDPYRKTLSEALNIRGVRISQAKVHSPGNAPGIVSDTFTIETVPVPQPIETLRANSSVTMQQHRQVILNTSTVNLGRSVCEVCRTKNVRSSQSYIERLESTPSIWTERKTYSHTFRTAVASSPSCSAWVFQV
jgi:hypothetical protein